MSCSPRGKEKAKDKLTWVVTDGYPVFFMCLMIDGPQVSVFLIDFSHPLHPLEANKY